VLLLTGLRVVGWRLRRRCGGPRAPVWCGGAVVRRPVLYL